MQLSIKSLRNHIFLWKLFGFWDLNGAVARPRWYRVYGICSQIVFLIIFPLGIFIKFFLYESIEELLQSALFLLPALSGLKVWILTVYNKTKLLHIFSLMDRLDEYIGEDVQRQATIKKGIKRAIFFNVAQFCLYNSTSTVLWIFAFMKPGRVLMWAFWLPFEYKESELVYQSVIFYQFVSTTISGAIHSTLDSIAAVLYSVVECHLEMLGQRMSNLGKNRREGEKINTPRYLEWQKSCEKELNECVVIHRLCIEFCDCTNDLLSLINMMQFGFTGISMCAQIFQLSVLDLTGLPLVLKVLALLATVMYFGCLTSQLFVPCLSAGEVTASSESLPYFLFGCNWQEQRREFKSSMFIFVERAKKPIIPMAGGLFEIGLPRFVAIMRAAYSMFTCMKNMSDE